MVFVGLKKNTIHLNHFLNFMINSFFPLWGPEAVDFAIFERNKHAMQCKNSIKLCKTISFN